MDRRVSTSDSGPRGTKTSTEGPWTIVTAGVQTASSSRSKNDGSISESIQDVRGLGELGQRGKIPKSSSMYCCSMFRRTVGWCRTEELARIYT